MTNEQINCAIAKACGISGNTYKPCLKTGNYEQSPNFCNDLNAMHEAEKTLEGRLQNGFVYELRWITESKFWGDFGHCHATARQRAEAFLRTLDKWEEGK